MQFSQECLVVERGLHAPYFGLFGISSERAKATPKSPTCSAYTNFLLATAFAAPVEVAVAAVLPCFLIYHKVGQHISAKASQPNPFQKWIDTYAGEEFGKAVEQACEITERLGQGATPATQAQMKEAFITACRLEWMFWDSAYRMEGWEGKGGPLKK